MGNQKKSSKQTNQEPKAVNTCPSSNNSPMQAVKTAKPLTQYRTNEDQGAEKR